MKSSATKRRDRRRALQVGAAGLLTLLAVLLVHTANPGLFGRLSALVFDFEQNLKPRPEAGAPVVIVDIDEASIRELGQWPWPRSEIARIVDRLRELGAAAIAFDVVFSEPDRTSLRRAAEMLTQAGAKLELPGDLPDNDEILAASFARNAVTAGFVLSNETDAELPQPKTGFAFAGADPKDFLFSFRGAVANLPILNEAAAGLGFYSFPPSPDGIVRTVPLVARGGEQLYPALSIEALRTAQGAGAIIIRATGASGEADTGRPAMTALKVGAFEVPTGAAGDFRVYYSGMPSMPRISAARFLDAASSAQFAEQLAGSLVLIGTSAVGLRDLVATPRSAAVPGVEVHAEIIDQILGGAFLTRPDWAPGAEIVAAVVLTILLIIAVLLTGPLIGAIAALVIIAAAIAASWFAFANGQLVIDPILPSIAVGSVYIVATALLLLLTDRERQFVRDAFALYLAPTLVERLAEDPAALTLGGETREITLLFSDIRGFTSLSERMNPQDITGLLNRFLTPMTDVLLKNDATIDKYMGDAIMAFWNAPLPTANHPRRACLAALAMLKTLDELNAREGTPIKIGVGLNTGVCCVGNLGSQQRFSYSAIGDPVNVASRVEGLTKQFGLQILITEKTKEHASDMALLEVDLVRVVGRGEPISILTLLGDEDHARSPEFSALFNAHSHMIASYRSANFADASAALERARGLAPARLHAFYDVYAERLAALKESPPEPGWDGVFTTLEK
ncbi:MAG: CHASE2 domain-containing protein [Propylenella sp.]